GDQHPLRLLVPAQPVPQVRRRAARARGVQRRPGERRPVARAGPRAHPVRGDARVRRPRRGPQAHLSRGVGKGARLPVTDWVLELAENANTYTPLGRDDERVVTDRYVLWMGRGDEPGWNVAQRFRLRADELDSVRDEVHARLRARGRTACTWE